MASGHYISVRMHKDRKWNFVVAIRDEADHEIISQQFLDKEKAIGRARKLKRGTGLRAHKIKTGRGSVQKWEIE